MITVEDAADRILMLVKGGIKAKKRARNVPDNAADGELARSDRIVRSEFPADSAAELN